MRLATFAIEGETAIGVVTGDHVAELARGPKASVRKLLEAGDDGRAWIVSQLDRFHVRHRLAKVRLAPPIPDPRKFLALGGNYSSHLAETAKIGIVRGAHQTWFNKQVTCLNGPRDPVWKPRVSDQFDYEGELGVIIGTRCRHVKSADWRAVVAGYVVVNDMSVRDWQLRAPTHMLGKSFDTHGPCGPWLVTADEIDDPHALRLTTHVNGQQRQSASTGDMIYSIGEMIAELTTAFTLEPGDILSTGSPAGVGGLMEPPCYLVPGDVVRVEIEGVGAIENPVIDEPVPAPPVERVAEEAML